MHVEEAADSHKGKGTSNSDDAVEGSNRSSARFADPGSDEESSSRKLERKATAYTKYTPPPPPALSRGFNPDDQVYMGDVDSSMFHDSSRDYEFVIVFPNQADSEEELKLFKQERNFILHRLLRTGFLVALSRSGDQEEVMARITAPEEVFETAAAQSHMNVKLKDQYGGGYVDFADFLEFRTRAEDAVNGDDEEDRMVGTDNLAKAHDMLEYSDGRLSKFQHVQRQRLIYYLLQSKKRGGSGLDLGHYLRNGSILKMFPLHDPVKLDDLADKWAYSWQKQPIAEIRNYFGERIALYFAWLGFYTTWLIAPSVLGFALFLYQTISGNFDNELVPVYCVFLSLWATLFLEFWKRRQFALAASWGMTDFEEEEQTRAQFEAEGVKEVAGEFQPYYPKWKQMAKLATSIPVILIFGICVVIAVVGILVFRLVMTQTQPQFGGIAAGVLNAVLINIMNFIYQKVAWKLNDWENHRTETAYLDNIIAKTFVFQFVNSYCSLFYIGFFKQHATIFGYQDSCKINADTGQPDCIKELSYQLGTIFVTRMIIQNFMEIGLPWLKKQYSVHKELKELEEFEDDQALFEEKEKGIAKLPPTEEQSKAPVYESTFDDYCEMIIQYGYVTMFAVAFPLTSTLALLNNLAEIRIDAVKLCMSFQRPLAQGAEDIGTWYTILELTSSLAVITNCAMFALGSHQLADYSYSTRIGIAIAAEHILFMIKGLLAIAIPDVPEELAETLKSQEFMAKRELGLAYAAEQFDHDEEEEYQDEEFDALWETEALAKPRRRSSQR